MTKIFKLTFTAVFTVALGFGIALGVDPWVCAQAIEDEFTLEEVVVTAEKREENIQKVPLSVSIVTSEEISNKSWRSVPEMLQNVVGLQVQGEGSSDAAGAKIFIRGIGLNNMDTSWGDPAIALNVDGVQQVRGYSLSMSMMDVERVEVLRGPQGTLYGRNATGGAINIVSVQPKDEFEASVKTQVGDYSARSFETMVNVPVNSKLALRVAGLLNKRDAYMTGADYGITELESYRLKAQYKPFEDMTLTGTVDYQKDTSTSGYVMIPAVNLGNDDPWFYVSTPSSETDDPEVKLWNMSLNLNWNIKDWTVFTFIPTFSRNTVHVAPDWDGPYPKTTQSTYEMRFSNTEDSKVVWTLAGFLYQSEYSGKTKMTGVHVEPYVQQSDRPNDSWAIFGQTTYPVMDRLRLVAGGRYNYDKKMFEYRVYRTDEEGAMLYDSGMQQVDTSGSKFTYKLGMEYDITEDSMIYIQATTGYKSGGLSFTPLGDENGNIASLDKTMFDPENSIAYEMGSKNRFLNNRVQVNASLFLTSYKGMQVQMPFTLNYGTENEQFLLRVLNAGKSSMYGGEIETSWLITEKDHLSANLSSLYGDYKDLYYYLSDPARPDAAPEITDLSGTSMANMPRLNLQVTYAHTFNLGDYGTLIPSIDINYKTKYYNTVETYINGALVPKHHISSFYLNWASQKGTWSANAFVKNIGDKAVATMSFGASGPGGGVDCIMLNNPRTFGISLTYKY